MPRRPFIVFLFLLALPVAAQKPVPGAAVPAGAPVNDQTIRPPFSLEWAEDSKRVELKIAAAKLTIKERRKIDARWALVVTGFEKPNANNPKSPKPPALQQVVFYFGGGRLAKDKLPDGKTSDLITDGALVEVELQYQQPEWVEADYNKCLGEKRQLIERTYGAGQQIVRETKELPEGKGTSTIVGYNWNRNNTAVELVYFTAETTEGNHVFHTLSLHYKSGR